MTAVSLNTAVRLMFEYVLDGVPVFLWGPPGVGKSDTVRYLRELLDKHFYGNTLREKAVALTKKHPNATAESAKAIAAKYKFGLVEIRLSQRESVDLRGLPLIDAKANTTRWLPPNELPQVERDGERGMLFIDEANAALSKSMEAAIMQLILEGKLGDYVLPKGWVIVAAGNRIADKAVATRLGTASRNRYAHIEVDKDLDSWVEWANRVNLHSAIVAFHRWSKGEHLHIMPKGDENCFPTPRGWERVAKFADRPEDIRQQLVAGIVGEGPAAVVEGFLRMWSRLPDLEMIKKNPKAAKVPPIDEPSVYFAVSSAIAREADKDNFENILIYAARLGKEFEVRTCVDAVKRDPSLQKTKAFAKWAVANQDVTI